MTSERTSEAMAHAGAAPSKPREEGRRPREATATADLPNGWNADDGTDHGAVGERASTTRTTRGSATDPAKG